MLELISGNALVHKVRYSVDDLTAGNTDADVVGSDGDDEGNMAGDEREVGHAWPSGRFLPTAAPGNVAFILGTLTRIGPMAHIPFEILPLEVVWHRQKNVIDLDMSFKPVNEERFEYGTVYKTWMSLSITENDTGD